MKWSSPADLKEQVMRLWKQGELLRSLATGDQRFPLRLRFKAPGSADITEHFDLVRNWSATLAETQPLRLEWREVQHRVQGKQRLPESVWIDTLDDALSWIGKSALAAHFLTLFNTTRQECSGLLPWLVKRPLKALELADAWPKLLAVVNWVIEHPRPGLYIRQIDIPGIHSKFIEKHCCVLAELLDLVLPLDAVATSKSGAKQFAARYGFLEKPPSVRFRILDESLKIISGGCCPDITLDAVSFRLLTTRPQRVFITENEINFLTFPQLSNAIVVFGAGYGWDAFERCQWLQECDIWYWGDIDTHGFAILDQLRARLSHACSFLMDRATLEEHRSVWGEEPTPTSHDLPRLTAHERELYDDLRNNRIRKNLRLEQEHIGFGWLQRFLERLS